jgi:hypothetical protein
MVWNPELCTPSSPYAAASFTHSAAGKHPAIQNLLCRLRDETRECNDERYDVCSLCHFIFSFIKPEIIQIT